MNHSLGLMIETLVAVLLVVTIGYCMLLNNRLKRLRSDEHSLKAVIAELITATEIAERAIGGLKHAVRDVNENLGDQLASAMKMSDHLKRQLSECDQVVRRLSKIAIAARPSQGIAQGTVQGTVQGTLQGTVQGTIIEQEPARLPPPKVSNAKAVAAAAQAFSERRRTGGLAA
jgi:hypothetical protein